jgi:hypothetical protein
MLQLEEGAVDLYSKIVKEDGLEIDMKIFEKPRTMDEYVQACQNQIWEHEFIGWFLGKDSYSKTKAFEDHKQMDLVLKCDGFKYEFISKKAFNSFST